MKLYVLNSGTILTERGFLWHFGTKADTGKEYVAKPYLVQSSQYYIEHPEAKILFDLGYQIEDFEGFFGGFPHRKDPEGAWVKQKPDENPVAQLGKIGVKVDDIDYVVISHLMSEHAGWLPSFAGKKAQIVVQEKEYEYAQRVGTPTPPGQEPAVEQFHSWMYLRKLYEVPGLNYKLIDGDYELVKDVTILHTPGHTPGYQVLLVRLPKTGTVIMSPCEHRGMYYDIPINGTAPGIPHSFTWFAAEELRSFKKIREIVEKEKGQVFYGHDAEQWQTLKHVPEYYE